MNEEQVAIIENTVLYKKWSTIVVGHFNKNTDSKLAFVKHFSREPNKGRRYIFNYENI